MSRPAPARSLRVVLFVAVLLGSLVAAVPATGGTTTVELATSDGLVDFGALVTLTVTIGGDPACVGARAVNLEWRPADSAGFAAVGSAVSGAGGVATLEQTQPHTGTYRASVLPTGECPAVSSPETLVRIRAFVDASVVTGSGFAGSCVDVAASVTPARPGQLVDLQRRVDGAWITIEEVVLDASSIGAAAPCFGFEDIGVVRLRVRWPAQDALNEPGTSPVLAFEIAPAPWMRAIADAIGGRSVSVAVGEEDAFLYEQDASAPRTPASNTKLLLSMAMLDAFGPGLRLRTTAAVRSMTDDGVVSDLLILGHGDPKVSKATIGALAKRIAEAGVTRVRGRVLGSTAYFRRDWDAPGWNDVARDYVNRPTALTFEGNDGAAPERAAAQTLTQRLEDLGIRVAGRPGSGRPPTGLDGLGFVASQPLQVLLQKLLRPSDNFMAEVLGKRLGVERAGTPGTIAKGAAATQAFVDPAGPFTVNDSSGLSYDNRVTADGMVRLLWIAEDAPWHEALRRALPTGGQGTLRDRLHDVEVRAKTGTLTQVSALSGWVHAEATDTWIEFSILSSGMDKSVASRIEDEIVTVLAEDLTL